MSTPALTQYLSTLHERGVKLWVDDGQLRYHAGKGTLSKEELARLRTLKDDIVIELTRPPAAVSAPASFQQRLLLALTQQQGAWQQAQAFAFHLTGSLDPQRLERSLGTVVRRHDSLRSRVVSIQGTDRLEIDAPRDDLLDVISVPQGFAAEETQNLQPLAVSLIARCADPAVGPMLYVRLVRISSEEHYLILVVHRLAADCTAIAQIFRELWLEYGERFPAQGAQLKALSGQYRDYTLGQQATQAQWQQKHAAWWEKYLFEAMHIQWPRDEAAARGEHGLALLQDSFGATLSASLRELGRQTQTLTALVMLALYVRVISRWCGQQDLIVPCNVAGRNAAHESVVGCFAHVVYLRVRLQGDEPFPDLLRRVSNEFYAAIFHQDSGRMALNRPDLLKGTFCQWLSWHPAGLGGPEMYEVPRQLGIAARPVHLQSALDFANVPSGVTDLDISFFESRGEIGMLLIFRHAQFAESTLKRFIQELRLAAEQIVSPQ